jgi:hypothetical protein
VGIVQSPDPFHHIEAEPVVRRQRREGSGGFGVASMVLGLLALLGSCAPLLPFGIIWGSPALILAVLAIIFGAIGSRSREGAGMAAAGLIMGVLTIVLWVIMVFAIAVMVQNALEHLSR